MSKVTVDLPHSRINDLIERALELKQSNVRFHGSSGVLPISLGLVSSNHRSYIDMPQVIITQSYSDSLKIQQNISFFDPNRSTYILPPFDLSPYSGLYPKQQIVHERLAFLSRCLKAKPRDVFIVSVQSVAQKTLPITVFKSLYRHFKKEDEFPVEMAPWLNSLGYSPSPLVEDVGQYAVRGGIVDLWPVEYDQPIRIELFGDLIESLRTFSPTDQRSLDEISDFYIGPCREVLFLESNTETVASEFAKAFEGPKSNPAEFEEMLRSLSREQYFPKIDFLLPFFYKELSDPLDYLKGSYRVWWQDKEICQGQLEQMFLDLRSEFQSSKEACIPVRPEQLFNTDLRLKDIPQTDFAGVAKSFDSADQFHAIDYVTHSIKDLSNQTQAMVVGSDVWLHIVKDKFTAWKKQEYCIFIAAKNRNHIDRLKVLFDRMNFELMETIQNRMDWNSWIEVQKSKPSLIHILQGEIPDSARIAEEKLIFIRDEEILGKKTRSRSRTAADEFNSKASKLAFGDLKPGDNVVHVQHGVGIYEGLKVMSIGGIDTEFIQVAYKDNDKLYLPIYRVGQLQKYSAHSNTQILDKLGGTGWEKTKSKVRQSLRDLAGDLLELYAKRAMLTRPVHPINDQDFSGFQASFPYEETEDQLRAINDFTKDLKKPQPMDRLVCGDVGFGKTEVAMRAAFAVVTQQRQVAVMAPTTVLTFQHFETFKKRFSGWPVEIRALNRFVSNQDAKKTLAELKDGKVDILIGTHRILSKDVEFKNLGLLIVDEEQKFGVAHKEKIKKMKANVDTLAMSATPIPRTLNMSLLGIRDLSIINTAPVDRLPTRTFITKWDEETIRRAIQSEIKRGGQIYFIHNRVQSIYGLADEIRQIVPEARIKVGHGQMEEHELEQTMISFFNHEIDILVCTTIVESGMDVPRANTMFIDQAHMMGLSQLYQLRGRVGRSKERAYCYLILPRGKQLDKDAQERLKVLQENSALGSGIRIAQYDLELRGAGDILGENQSGHISSVGYEMYMDLLNEAIAQSRGQELEPEIEPEINIRIPARIPESYISDVRLRLTYYKSLTDIQTADDVDRFEEELKDQFGNLPDEVNNLLGIMLIRAWCKKLGIRDISSGPKNISLIFTEKTPLKTETIIKLAMRENKKYSISPDNRMSIRLNNITWPAVFEELDQLLRLAN